MTDNFNRYREFIELSGGLPATRNDSDLDRYYVIELMRRGKDNPGMQAANYHFNNYYIYSWQDLESREHEIKAVCDLLNMRAYCSVNHKSMKQVALDTMAESARRIAMGEYKGFNKIFESCSGKYFEKGHGLWIIDVDDTKEDKALDILSQYVEQMESGFETNIIYRMPSKTGMHLICHPFNLKQFIEGYVENVTQRTSMGPVEVKKNHLTLLYENIR